MHRAAPEFWDHLADLPLSIQTVARRNFERLKENPLYPSLHFKRVGDYWSVRVGDSYRALALPDGPDFLWVWIGEHDDYKRIINS